MNALRILGENRRANFSFLRHCLICKFSFEGGTCYDLVNAYACFCPDRIFRPQCNTTVISPTATGSSVLMSSSNRKCR